MNLTEIKTKDSEIIKIPAYIKIIKLRKTVGGIVGTFFILTIIAQFISYSFWHSILYTLILLVSWFIINLILNLIFNPIITSLLKQYSDK